MKSASLNPDCGDVVLQRAREPVQRRHDEGVAGVHELRAGGQLGPVGVAAGLLLREDAPAAGGLERVELTLALDPIREGPQPTVDLP